MCDNIYSQHVNPFSAETEVRLDYPVFHGLKAIHTPHTHPDLNAHGVMEASSGHIESAQEINNLTHMHKHTRTYTVTLLLALGCGVLGQISTPSPQRIFFYFLKLCSLTLSLNLLSSQTPDQNTNVQYVNTVQDLLRMEQ